MNVDSPGDDINLLGPELKVVDPLEDDVPARDLRVRQLVVQQRVRRRDHRGALDAPHQRILKRKETKWTIAHFRGMANHRYLLSIFTDSTENQLKSICQTC